ncbi:Nuclear hormone receptor HR96 [Melipona quadrifasciata]|uniref:Nuclear hormone receptor HR96 n=1 Tax=Melipona quadrifasciata TaxID=166423 RepID=A0A0N0U4M5_9HYME|nr:Nuclear hormone receptor HR96 [Melipona quadrifasciata]
MEDEQPARETNKICGVCGDRALGYNFNAVSCESCKAFFRRNALKNKDFRCPFTENCNITPVTRRFCQKCRLDKCFSIGMRKEYIMSEEDKVLKRQKIEQNRAKKRPTLENTKPSKIKKAASVPSPSSPPENEAISGSKTLDMMKDSSQNSNFETQQRFDKVKPSSHNVEKDKKSIISSRKFDQNILDLNSEFAPANHESMKYSSEFDNASCCNKFDCSPVQNSQYIEHTSHYRKTNVDMGSGMHTNVQICSQETVSSQKQSRETCSKEDNFVSNKLPQDSTLITKLVNNSNFITKIFQNEELLLKIISDPVVISKLEADPQTSHFFKRSGIVVDKEISPEKETNTHFKDDAKPNHNNSSHTLKTTFKVKQKQVENPILTDLITNSSQEECIRQRDDSNEWNRNLSDVTRDVLQDVQRYSRNSNLFKV